MDKLTNRFVRRVSVAAVQGALATMITFPAAYAADPTVEELTTPKSTIEVGAGAVNKDSYKFGEYNGLQKKGGYFIGDLDLRGGDPFDSGGTYQWRVTGTDLGLDSRSLGFDVGKQGTFRIKYSYDELRRNYSDSYQTFYAGAGGSVLTIPAFAGTPAANRLSSTTTVNGALSNWGNIQSPYATAACAATGGVPTAACAGPGYLLPAAMHNFNVDSMRKKHNVEIIEELSNEWQLRASVRHEERDGTKLTGVAFGGPARGVLVPEPLNSTTDQFRTSLNYVQPGAHFTIGYTGSIFKNSTNEWTVENPFAGNLLNAAFNNSAHLSGAPDNQMHQLSVSGGYQFAPATKLVVSANYQRMTQNKNFLNDLPSAWVLPETSAHAKVINTSLNAVLTTRPFKDFAVTAQYKFEDRDNKTPSLNFFVLGGDAAGTTNLFTNRPLNFRTQQFSLDGNYTLGRRQFLKLGYEWKEIKRSVTAEPPPPAEEETPFRSEKTTENTLRAEYSNNLSQFVTGRISYAYSERRASEYEENVLLPVPAVAPFPAADPMLPGFRQFFLADRNRDRVRGGLNFQVSESLSLQTGIEYNRDRYPNSQYGLQSSKSSAFNLDLAFSASEDLSFNAFYVLEDKKSERRSLVIGRGSTTTILDAPASRNPCTGYFAATGHLPSDEGTDVCRQWSENQADRVNTLGVGFKMQGLVSKAFDLDANLSYSRAVTPIGVSGGAYFGNGSNAAAPAFNNIYVAAESFPDITSEVIELRLKGTYAIDKTSSIGVHYLYRRLKSSDWQYDAYANAALGVLAIPVFPGTNMTAPNYDVQAIGVTYIYRFR